MKGFSKWMGMLFSSNGKVSSKRVAFLMVVVSSIVWLSYSIATEGITNNWVAAFNVLVVATIGGYVGGAVFGENKSKNKDEDDLPEDYRG